MKTMFSFFLLVALLIAASIFQDAFSGASGLYQAYLFLVPIVFCFGALVLSLPAALLFGLVTGLLEGLMTLSFQHDHVEIGLGWFIFFFMSWSVILQLASDLTGGIRWELHALGSALCTVTFLLGEFLLLSLHRGHFSITESSLIFIAIPSAIALLISPLLYALLQFLLPPATPVRVSQ